MKKKIFIGIIIILVIIIAIIFVVNRNTSKEKLIQEIEKTENLSDEEKNKIDEVKQETGKTGEAEIYEIDNSYNTKVAVVKTSIKYKVAFAGMIKNDKPEISELDNIIDQNHPEYAGIWIYEKDREQFLEYLELVTNSKYAIDENGYLRIKNKDNQNSNDKKIEKIINGNKLCIISISSLCYIVDEITGEILDYTFENIDKYQTYEYFEDNDKKIIFMTENRSGQLEEKEIINSVIDLL